MKLFAYLHRVRRLAFFPLDFLPPIQNVYFVSFLHEVVITSRTVHTVVRSDAYKSAKCLIMFWQKDRLHSSGATAILVDSFRRDLWMFLYEAYFV